MGIATGKEKDDKKKEAVKELIGFGRIPKKTPEQQQQELLNKKKGRKRREFSPEPMMQSDKKYNHRNAYDHSVRRSSSRSNSSHSNHSSHSSNNYRNHSRTNRNNQNDEVNTIIGIEAAVITIYC